MMTILPIIFTDYDDCRVVIIIRRSRRERGNSMSHLSEIFSTFTTFSHVFIDYIMQNRYTVNSVNFKNALKQILPTERNIREYTNPRQLGRLWLLVLLKIQRKNSKH